MTVSWVWIPRVATRGIHTHDTVMHTKHLSGVFREDANLRREFFDALR